jgi:hypothetical protein
VVAVLLAVSNDNSDDFSDVDYNNGSIIDNNNDSIIDSNIDSNNDSYYSSNNNIKIIEIAIARSSAAIISKQ